MLKQLIRLWHHLSRRRQRQFGLLLGLMLVSAFFEVVSLGAVLPFLGVLISPESVFNREVVKDSVQFFGITTADQLILPITIAFALAALMSGGIRSLLLWASTRLAFSAGSDISIKVYRNSLYQPYQVHVARNSSEIFSATEKAHWVVGGVMLPILTLISSIVFLVAIVIVLITIDPSVALISILGFGLSYGLITRISRKRLNENSRRISYEQTKVVKAVQEGLGGIRDVLLDGTQRVYCDVYHKADQTLRRAQGGNVFIAGCPRFAMESIGMVLITALAYVLSRQDGGIAVALPVLGSLALSAQRLLPTLQNIYTAWASIVGSQSSLVDVINLLDQPLPIGAMDPTPPPLAFTNAIEFKNVRFRYGVNRSWVLDGINLILPKGARVGFVGPTGSGKSTALDLLMGLLSPTEGELLVDGKPVSDNLLRAWQRTIAHVPQSIYLADITLAENIAFGVPFNDIDMERVKKAASQAQIANHIESLPEGYASLVGERGVRLSGGQRQRIGIARALYKQATVLIFDEATSALDNQTEQDVMQSIEQLSKDITIIIVAHRLTTLKNCDQVIELKDGKVSRIGNYKQLMNIE